MRRRSYHRLLIVFGILSVLLALAQDQHTIKVESAYGAEDPKFASYVAALVNAEPTGGNRYQVLTNGDEIFPPMIAAIATAKRRIGASSWTRGNGGPSSKRRGNTSGVISAKSSSRWSLVAGRSSLVERQVV